MNDILLNCAVVGIYCDNIKRMSRVYSHDPTHLKFVLDIDLLPPVLSIY